MNKKIKIIIGMISMIFMFYALPNEWTNILATENVNASTEEQRNNTEKQPRGNIQIGRYVRRESIIGGGPYGEAHSFWDKDTKTLSFKKVWGTGNGRDATNVYLGKYDGVNDWLSFMVTYLDSDGALRVALDGGMSFFYDGYANSFKAGDILEAREEQYDDWWTITNTYFNLLENWVYARLPGVGAGVAKTNFYKILADGSFRKDNGYSAYRNQVPKLYGLNIHSNHTLILSDDTVNTKNTQIAQLYSSNNVNSRLFNTSTGQDNVYEKFKELQKYVLQNGTRIVVKDTPTGIAELYEYQSSTYSFVKLGGGEEVNIPDRNLKKELNRQLGQVENSAITRAQMEMFRDRLDLRNKGISNPEGLQYAKNVTSIWIENNNLTQLGAISNMTWLTELYIYENPITSLEGIQKLTKLEILIAYLLGSEGSRLKDIIPLTSMVTLKYLDLGDNDIRNVEALSGLINLEDLYLSTNKIEDISPLQSLVNVKRGHWRTQKIRGAEVTSVGAKAEVTNVIKRLNGSLIPPTASGEYDYTEPTITFKNITTTNDYSYTFSENVTIGSVTSAFSGTVTHRIIKDEIVNIPDVNLRKALNELLGKGSDNTNDIYQLEMASFTGTLKLDNKEIINPEGLQYATNIKSLIISQNKLTQLSVISDMNWLTELSLNQNLITSLEGIQKLTNLKVLSAYIQGTEGSRLKDITPLKDMTTLRYLSLRGNDISDVKALSGLTGLDTLYLNRNQITDLSPLTSLVNVVRGDWFEQRIRGVETTAVGTKAEVTNVIKRLNGSLIPPTASGEYDYTEPTITFKNITTTNDYSYTFSEDVTIGTVTSAFSGTVTHKVNYVDIFSYISIPKSIELENVSERYIGANEHVYVINTIGSFEYAVEVDKEFEIKNTEDASNAVQVTTYGKGISGGKELLGTITKDNTADDPLKVEFKASRDTVDRTKGRWEGTVKFYIESKK